MKYLLFIVFFFLGFAWPANASVLQDLKDKALLFENEINFQVGGWLAHPFKIKFSLNDFFNGMELNSSNENEISPTWVIVNESNHAIVSENRVTILKKDFVAIMLDPSLSQWEYLKDVFLFSRKQSVLSQIRTSYRSMASADLEQKIGVMDAFVERLTASHKNYKIPNMAKQADRDELLGDIVRQGLWRINPEFQKQLVLQNLVRIDVDNGSHYYRIMVNTKVHQETPLYLYWNADLASIESTMTVMQALLKMLSWKILLQPQLSKSFGLKEGSVLHDLRFSAANDFEYFLFSKEPDSKACAQGFKFDFGSP